MTEDPTQTPPESKTTARWKSEASALRATAGFESISLQDTQYSDWQKVLIWLLIAVSLCGSTLLLAVPSLRNELVGWFDQAWTAWSGGGPQSKVFRIPPPPPRTVEPKFVDNAARITVPDEIWEATGEPSLPDSAEKPVAVQLPKDETFRAAFSVLTSASEVAGRLIRGEIEGYDYRDWNPIQKSLPQLLIELVAVAKPDGPEVKFIWSVNIETNQVLPLSQAARDLEAKPAR